MATLSQHRIVTHVLFALVILATVASVSEVIATPAALPAAAAPAAVMPWPGHVDRHARLSPGIGPQTAAALQAGIRSTAFTCDRVSGARANALTAGFTVDCDHNAFSYEVWNRDGEWTAEPQR